MSVVSLERVQRNARSYPGFLLQYGDTALSLFAAGYHGWNDCVHFLRHDMVCDCVDIDAQKLTEMKLVYPDSWRFHFEDAWEFAAEARLAGDRWDVVSVDTFLGEHTERSVDNLCAWTDISRKLVTATMVIHDEPEIPAGWVGIEFPRSPRASWLVLTPE